MPRLPNAYVADLPHGAVLVVHPEREPQLFTDSERALKWLERGGWDYYVTHQNSDTGDEIEQWIPVGDDRFDREDR